MIFVTSDWHLFHKNIFKYAKRLPAEMIDYQNELINFINENVSESDILIFLGDLSFRTNKRTVKKFISSLKCKNLHFIRGNHDNWLSDKDILDFGFKTIQNYLVINENIFYHYPLQDSKIDPEYGEDKNFDFLKTIINSGKIKNVFHGHSHNLRSSKEINNIKYINCCIDAKEGKMNLIKIEEKR